MIDNSFVKVYCTNNLSGEEKMAEKEKCLKWRRIMYKTNFDGSENVSFTMDELKTKTRETAPAKDQICYSMFK